MAAEEIRHRSSDALDHIQIAEEKVLVGSKFIKVDNSPRPDQVDPQTLCENGKERSEALQ